MKRKISMMDVKTALLDNRFRDKLPDELLNDVQKFLSNPNCGCNHPIYRRVMKTAIKELADYFPNKEATLEEPEKQQNQWTVINCHINEIAQQLRRLPPGQKQLEIARWQDQATIIINELET